MKKFLATLLTICMIVTSTAFVFPITTFAEDSNSTITVTDLNSLKEAFNNVSENGTISVNGDLVIPESSVGYVFGTGKGKTFTITGGSFDFTALTSGDGSKGFVYANDNITFENTTFKFDTEKNDYLFANGYSVTISDTVVFEGAKVCFYGGPLNKGCNSINVTILGGNYTTINGTSNSKQTISGDVNVHFGGNAVVSDILGNSGGCTVNGNVSIIIDGSANVSGVYGGGNGGTINGNTSVTVSGSATVKQVYGGGSAGTINGSTTVTLEGNANPDHTVSSSDHSKTYAVYGGGKNNTITGSTNVIIKDSAKSNYIFGGSAGTSTIGEGSHVNMLGGEAYSIYGGSPTSDHGSGASVLMLGGTVHQLFGGNEGSNLTGGVTIKLLGGTVMRRVFGGCYNNYSTDLSNWGWQSEYFVSGTITLIIGDGANLLLNSDSDNALSAHSRRATVESGETGIVLFTNTTAQSNNNLSKGSVSGGSAANATHCHSYTISGNIVTQSCTCGNSATANVTSGNATYTGEAINTKIEYSDNWEYDQFEIAHSNNVNAGTATATFTVYNNQVHSVNYSILKASQKAPVVKAENNTIKDLATTMEYSSDNGATYTAVTNPAMTFESGKYFVRYAEDANHTASNAVKLFFGNVISANKVSALCGKTVEVIISIPSNSGTSALDITVGYDKDIFELTSITSGNVVTVTGDTENGKITWIGNATTKTGLLAKLTFKVNETAEKGDYAITLTNQNGISVVNGAISVVEYVTGDVSGDDGKITISDIVDLRNAIVNEETGTLASGADANGDGAVDVRDLIVIRQYIANYNYDEGESSVILGGAQ